MHGLKMHSIFVMLYTSDDYISQRLPAKVYIQTLAVVLWYETWMDIIDFICDLPHAMILLSHFLVLKILGHL